MSASRARTALRFVAGLATVIFFVVLLTTIFSFLGAFFCAALAGMMLGSVKLPRWNIAAVSLIFPAVLFGVVRAGAAELLLKQTMLLSVLCLSTFWFTYLVVRAVVVYERKGQPSSVSPPLARVNAPSGCDVLRERDTTPECLSTPSVGFAQGQVLLTLQSLQGKWSCPATGSNSHCEQKFMEIENDRLLLTVSDSNGKLRVLGEVAVTLNNPDSVRLLTAAAKSCHPTDDTLVSI